MKDANTRKSVALVFAVAFCCLIALNSQGNVWDVDFHKLGGLQLPRTVGSNSSTSPVESTAISLSPRPIANFLLAGAQKAGKLDSCAFFTSKTSVLKAQRRSNDRYNSFGQLFVSQTRHMWSNPETWAKLCEFQKHSIAPATPILTVAYLE